jgi:phospholipid/cholesterol/gamma-HCH transport system substrate-binding protein
VKRAAAILVALIAAAVILVTGSAAGGDDGNYEVRAIFDNASFLVQGEEVRVAGATVGAVKEVTVTNETEAAHADGEPDPGKAVVVLEIDDPGFQDFREDASCLIRPQSLLGEKYVECKPTQPRAAGSPAPPPLKVIGDGEPGEGEHLLPVESNSTSVDLDLVNNIMREPYADRFRLILNSLGATLAARGDDLAEIVDRSDPALRETNKVLAILRQQNQALADLARNGDAVLTPLARDRDRIGGFINSAAQAGEATAERGAELQRNFALLPETLREVRSTMTQLKQFSEAGTPTFQALGAAAPAATRATKALGPFADSADTALTSLGNAAQKSQAPLVKSDSLIKQIRKLSKSAAPAASNLSALLHSFDKRGGFKNILKFVYRAAGAFNGFDAAGHYLRAFLLITNCNDYVTAPQTGCIANFLPPTETTTTKLKVDRPKRPQRSHDTQRPDQPQQGGDDRSGGAQTQPAPRSDEPQEQQQPPTTPADGGAAPEQPPLNTEPAPQTTPEAPQGEQPDTGEPGVGVTPGAAPRIQKMRDARALMNFLVGQPSHQHRGAKR